MNDQGAFERFVADQFAREPGSSVQADVALNDLLSNVSHTRQRPRWLAILKEPPMRHASRVVVGSPTARVAALAAATLLMALLVSGALVAGAQTPSPAPLEESPPMPPTEFSGVWCIGPPVALDRNGTTTRVEVGDDGVTLTRYEGGAWRNAVVASDPRLRGDAYQTYESDTYDLPGINGVIASTLSIVNEDGAWVSASYRGEAADGTELGNVPSIFVGEGAYEGLIAIMTDPGGGRQVLRPDELPIDYGPCSEVQGVIFDGAPVPEPYLE